jgi:hypothetical protein
MSLTKEQKRDLNQLSEYYRKIEKLAVANNIDLDVFMTEYREDGFSVYSTEKISVKSNAEERKNVFEKAGKDKSKSTTKNL